MSTSLFLLQKSFSAAFSRLQTWFDPAMTGSPYETLQSKKDRNSKHQSPYFSKRLSIRI